MKLYDMETAQLLRLLEKTKGGVYLKTEDGNVLNLKSGLCRHYGVEAILKGARECAAQADLSVETPEDELLFIDHMTRK